MITCKNRTVLKCMKGSFLGVVFFGLIGISSICSQTITYFETGEEFAGPFPSWKNIKTDFGANCAKGDGVTNDAPAINAALQSMANIAGNTWNVLYFPAGSYRITSTIRNVASGIQQNGDDYSGMALIGADPATTTIFWDGATDGAMMIMDGWNQKLCRITFDGKNKALVGLSHEGSFSTGNEMSDLVFKDMQKGIDMSSATSGNGQAETTFLRCKFINLSNFGIAGCNYNTLDLYTWYCLFQDCGTAIYGCVGQFQVFQNVFLRSKVADMKGGICSWSITNNISVGSKAFRVEGQTTLLHGNKIYNVQSTIDISGWGNPYGIIDNIITCNPSTLVPFSTRPDMAKYTPVFLVGNTYTVSNPVTFSGAPKDSFPCMILGSKIVGASTITPPLTISLPGTPPNKNRTLFEVPAGDDGTKIQAAIVSACSTLTYGHRAIVHIPKGIYNIKRTLVVPSKRDIQIIGDGEGSGNVTKLVWAGTGVGPMLRCLGPSKVTIRNLHLYVSYETANIENFVIENADQPGGRIYAQRVLAGGPDASRFCDIGILVDGVENSDVTSICGGVKQAENGGLKAIGGAVLGSGGTTNSQIALLSGASSNSYNLFSVANGGRITAEGMWYEGNMSKSLLSLKNTQGSISLAAMHWSTSSTPASVPLFDIENFNGSFTFLSNDLDQAPYTHIRMAGNGSKCNVTSLCQNYRGTTIGSKRWATNVDSIWCDSTSPAGQNIQWGCGSGLGNEWSPTLPVVNKTHLNRTAVPDSQAIYKALEQMRSLRIEPAMDKTDTLVTDVKLYSIVVDGAKGKTALHIKGLPVGVVDNPIGQSLYNRHPGNVQKVIMSGSIVRIPEGTKQITAFDLTGKVVFIKEIGGDDDVRTVQKTIQGLSRHSMLIMNFDY